MKPSDRYLKIVDWSEVNQCYVGTCPGLMLGGVHGDNEAKVYAELCQVVDEWVGIHEEDREPLPEPTAGKDYSGRFLLRVGSELHKELAVEALRRGESLNSYCVRVLRDLRQPCRASRRRQSVSRQGTAASAPLRRRQPQRES